MSSNLKAKTLSGMIWSFMQRFGTMAISFVSNIVLARLLTPDDYGVIGMLAIFIAISNTFIDGGFGSALIQKKEPTKEDYSTIFWWNMFLSIVLYALLYVCAPLIASFYKLPMLSVVLRVQGVVLIINALSIIQQNQLRKQLKFKRLATVTVISATLSAGIAIVLAWQGWGLWALVAQQILLSTFTAIILWVLNKWYPSLVFSKESFKQLFGFGGFILASSLINTFCNNIQGLLIGRFFPPAILGYFTQARKLEEIASTSMTNIVEQVSYPILVQFQDNKQDLIKITKRLILLVSFVTMPLMVLLIILSHQIILSIYTEKWLPCVPYFNILCIAGLAICMQGIHICAVASAGKSKEMFMWTLYKRFTSIMFLLFGYYIAGIYGLLWAMVVGSWMSLIINAYLTSKYIGYKLSQQIVDILPNILIVSICYIISLIISSYLNIGDSLESIIQALLFILFYILAANILKIEAFIQLKNIGIEYFKKARK